MANNNDTNQMIHSENRSTVDGTMISNELQQQHPITPCLRSEIEAEEDLFKEIKQLIHRFLTCPGRRYPYHTTIRWLVNPPTIPHYSVFIKIDHPIRDDSN
jgi:hypothetical protein